MNDNPALEQDLEDVSRRKFVQVAVTGVTLAYVGAIGYPLYRYLNAPVEDAQAAAAVKEVLLEGADKLEKGTALIFKFGVRPAMLIHHLDDTWIALNAVCTHMGCTVSYDKTKDAIVCACHGGVYNSHTGENVSGPPPRPLNKFEVVVNTGSVLVKRV